MNCFLCGAIIKNKVLYKHVKNTIDQFAYANVLQPHGNYISICCNCLNNSDDVFYCVQCNKYYLQPTQNMSDGVCRKCYFSKIDYEEDYVLPYQYKPTPIFFGTNDKEKMYMGMQLQMDNIDEDLTDSLFQFKQFINKTISKQGIGYSFFYGKYDGSLSDNGVQVVSHPATLEYHLQTPYWEKMLEQAKAIGLKSNDCENCGIHIHCNRDYFNNLQIQKLDALVNYHSRVFRRFGRRNSRSYGSYFPNKNVINLGHNDTELGRYSALNFDNGQTIQWRIFKGNTKYESVMALFELVQGVSDFVKQDYVTIEFIHQENAYVVKKALKQYLQSRNFKFLPDYTTMCKVWRDLEDRNNE